jgi:hypothetical protein
LMEAIRKMDCEMTLHLFEEGGDPSQNLLKMAKNCLTSF